MIVFLDLVSCFCVCDDSFHIFYKRPKQFNKSYSRICEKLGLWTVAGSGLLISMLEKLNWFHLTGPITLVLLISYGHALNAVVISGLVLLFATWNC